MELEELDTDIEGCVAEVMEDFDTSHNSQIDAEEFVRGMSRWLKSARHSAASGKSQNEHSIRLLSNFHQVYNFLYINGTDPAYLCDDNL